MSSTKLRLRRFWTLALLAAPGFAQVEAAHGSGIRVVELSGAPRARGLAHGRALKREIGELVARWKADLKRTYRIEADEFIERFLDATEFDVAIERWTPGLLDEVRGIAEGAGVDYDTMFAFQLIDEVWAQGRDVVAHKCTAIGVDRRGDQPTIVAQNLDIPRWYHGYQTLLRVEEESGVESFVVTVPGLVGANGMNSGRVAVAVNTLLQLRPSRDGLPVAFVVRGVLAQPDRAAAVAFVRKIRHASGQNYTIGGPAVAEAFECSAGQVAGFRPFAAARYTYHTNHPLSNDDWAPRYLAQAERLGREPADGLYRCRRFEALERRLAEGTEIDVDVVRAALASRDDPNGPICNPSTFACTIMLLGERPELRVSAGRPDRARFETFRFGDRAKK